MKIDYNLNIQAIRDNFATCYKGVISCVEALQKIIDEQNIQIEDLKRQIEAKNAVIEKTREIKNKKQISHQHYSSGELSFFGDEHHKKETWMSGPNDNGFDECGDEDRGF